jgi:5-(carboxyamino)imidazole ribonucleotide synthase
VTTLGILGGGQLGRMLALEAARHGVRTVVRTDDAPGGPAAQVADAEIAGPYDDEVLNDRFAACVDAVTSEFENLPRALLEGLEARVPVRPSAISVWTCQHREREKRFLAARGIPHAPFAVVTDAESVAAAVRALGTAAVLKTAAFGYDGRGQVRIGSADDADRAWATLGTDRAVVEGWVPFVREISVVGARDVDAGWAAFPPGENVHVDGILDHTIAPARIPSEVASAAVSVARTVADALGHVGTIGVEMFVLADGSLVVNEIAPRPHNSGHHTIDACATSQFGLQLVAATGGSVTACDTAQHSPAVMVNLLGELWARGEPRWSVLDRCPAARLHLYGKASARPGRKMGHLTVLGTSPEEALALRAALRR